MRPINPKPKKPNPELDPSIAAKLATHDMEGLAKVIGTANQPNWVDREQLDAMPTRTWAARGERVDPAPARINGEPLVYFDIISRRNQTGKSWRFLANASWTALAVPLDILPPEYTGDPLLLRWRWWDGPGAAEIKSEDSAKVVARMLVDQHDGFDPEEAANRPVYFRFEVRTPKTRHFFLTRPGYFGLWAPVYMAPAGSIPDKRRKKYAKVLTEEECYGEKSVRTEARKLTNAYDRIAPFLGERKSPTRTKGYTKSYYLCGESRDAMKKIQEFVNYLDFDGCTDSKAIRYALIHTADSLPPKDQWRDMIGKRAKP